MNSSDVQLIWDEVIRLVSRDPDVGPATAGQLGLAAPRGITSHTLYLAVSHPLTLQLIERRLQPAIMRALAQIPDAGEIQSFVVLVDPEVTQELLDREEALHQSATAANTENVPSQDAQVVQFPSGEPADDPQPVDPHQQDRSVTGFIAPDLPAREPIHNDFSGSDVPHRARFSGAADPSIGEQDDDVSRGNSGTAGPGGSDGADGYGSAGRGEPHRDYGRPKPKRPVDHEPRHGVRDTSEQSRLNENYRFESFVIGQSNRFAHAAAVAVAEAPARAYNPLFIYGDSGLGKTHLLHAIGHYARELFPDIRVRYVSSEDFTNDFINSIQNNRGAQFHERYRSTDVLLVDDIQFLAGKPETQEAFFHTFNTLHGHQGQVVITSDVLPKQLKGFEERMLSRFEWGLLTDIQAPDLETRIAILRNKAQMEGVTLDDDIFEFIAKNSKANIRELEGNLIRVTAFATLDKQQIDLGLVQHVLKDILSPDNDSEVQPGDIISEVSEYFNISLEDLHGPGRSQQVALARQIAMYLCRELTPLSLPKIGQLFGGRDHTTVMYAHKKIASRIAENRATYKQVHELTSRIKQGH